MGESTNSPALTGWPTFSDKIFSLRVCGIFPLRIRRPGFPWPSPSSARAGNPALGTTSVFKGTIIAQASITLNTGATLNGRAAALTSAVTLAGNSVIKP
jgi:hypothetical protein